MGGGGGGRQRAGGEGPQRPRMEGGGKYLCHLGERTRSGMELRTSDETRAALGSGWGWRVMGGEGEGGYFFLLLKKCCCCFNYLKYGDVKVKLFPFLWF